MIKTQDQPYKIPSRPLFDAEWHTLPCDRTTKIWNKLILTEEWLSLVDHETFQCVFANREGYGRETGLSFIDGSAKLIEFIHIDPGNNATCLSVMALMIDNSVRVIDHTASQLREARIRSRYKPVPLETMEYVYAYLANAVSDTPLRLGPERLSQTISLTRPQSDKFHPFLVIDNQQMLESITQNLDWLHPDTLYKIERAFSSCKATPYNDEKRIGPVDIKCVSLFGTQLLHMKLRVSSTGFVEITWVNLLADLRDHIQRVIESENAFKVIHHKLREDSHFNMDWNKRLSWTSKQLGGTA